MSIDIERLKWDAAYWDEVAPEGATHLRTVPPCLFYKPDHYWSFQDRKWVKSLSLKVGETCLQNLPARPKPQSSEWDGGLPPVGCKCEMKIESSDWLRGTVKYINKCGVVFKPWGTDLESFISTATTSMEFRPIYTQAEREREAVIDQAYKVLQRCDVHHSGVAALYDAGMLVAPSVDAEVGHG